MAVGIYKITNQVNGKSYIGQSIDIERRWKDEKSASKDEKDTSYNYPLSKAFRKYGIENFTFEILEECKREDLNKRERYWISFYDSFFNGYNQTFGGEQSCINILKENIKGIINDLKTTMMKHQEIADRWGVSIETVQGINTGRHWYQDNENYPLQKKKIIIKDFYCEICGKPITRKAKKCVDCAKITSRKVERPSKDKLFDDLTEYNGNFTAVAKLYGVTDNAIRKWCKNYELPHHSGDYKKQSEN